MLNRIPLFYCGFCFLGTQSCLCRIYGYYNRCKQHQNTPAHTQSRFLDPGSSDIKPLEPSGFAPICMTSHLLITPTGTQSAPITPHPTLTHATSATLDPDSGSKVNHSWMDELFCLCVCVRPCACQTHINQPDIVDSFVLKPDWKGVVNIIILHTTSSQSNIKAQENYNDIV